MRPIPPASPSTLPPPDAASSAHSARVVEAVRARIDAAGGWIAFADYMQLALYAPGLGYYVAGARKFGADGDFVTAPEMTPLFAQALAVQVRAILDATPARELVEFGAGSGMLAADLLNALATADALPTIYRILEVSPDLRERQRETIARRAASHLARVAWIDRLPPRIEGVALMNEVLDAIPPHVIVRRGSAWFERGVTWRGALALDDRPLSEDALHARAAQRFPADDDYASEINPAAEALTAAIGARIAGGALLVLDYGFPQAEYYTPQRRDGTLMAHYRHHALTDPLVWPGLADLTAHVDFSAIALAGERGGLTVAGYAPQAAFLVNCGILDRLCDVGEPTTLAYLREAAAVQKLLSPAEMGELFKVLALTKSDSITWLGFAAGDRTHRL
jgi:SAM-dependent MidA family methyltransferase